MKWTPVEIWEGLTVFIIGGGPSLKGFDYGPLHGEKVIGCNDAYQLGDWVDICYFGDNAWYIEEHREKMESWKGLKITCAPSLMSYPEVFWMERKPRGMWPNKNWIGWFFSTGASAVHLAMKLGAKCIVLLGFDMNRGGRGEVNWHKLCKSRRRINRNMTHTVSKEMLVGNCLENQFSDKTKEELFAMPLSKLRKYFITKLQEQTFARHIEGFEWLKEDRDKCDKFKDVKILNATPGSALKMFPMISVQEVLS